MQGRTSLYIGGRWHSADEGQAHEVVSASTEEVVAQVRLAGVADVDAAVAAARSCLAEGTWTSLGEAERSAALLRFADALDKRGAEIATAVSTQNGMPIVIAQAVEATVGAQLLRYYAGLIQAIPREERRQGLISGTTLVTRDPVGVVAAIVPWNFPQVLTFFKVAPALAAGCAVVVKPAPETTLDAFLLADAADEAGLPAGVINVIPGDAAVGSRLVQHPGVDKVAFTGSTRAGREIARQCADLLRPVTLELGGKSAAVILDDADLGTTVPGLFAASLLNNGQTCYLGTRILASRTRYDEVVDALTAMVSALKVGDALDPATQIGPLASRAQRERVEGHIAAGRAAGATVTTGGGRPKDLSRGWFVEPTVFTHVTNADRIAREEIFGPVLAVIPFGDEDDAIAIANDSDYGLGGSIWTNDVEKGERLARRVSTGSIGVNGYALDPGAPFGGVKQSGLGRELGPEGLAAYQQLKSIYLPS